MGDLGGPGVLAGCPTREVSEQRLPGTKLLVLGALEPSPSLLPSLPLFQKGTRQTVMPFVTQVQLCEVSMEALRDVARYRASEKPLPEHLKLWWALSVLPWFLCL